LFLARERPTYQFIPCFLSAARKEDPLTVAPLPREVIEMMAKREHRMHHWLWHEIRNNWNQYPKDVQAKIEELGWRPPRPLQDEVGRPSLHNHSGEDFLFMHRQMIADVNAVLTQVGDPNYPRIEGWVVVPPPGDPDYPVPPAWFNPAIQDFLPFSRLQRMKSDVFYNKRFVYWQKLFTNPGFLRSVSLGELGVLIELTIHNVMHLRWASSPGTSLPNPDDPTQVEATIPAEWDDPRFDFMGETYSSHVNPIFWKLHGWIDDRVENWKLANGVFGNDFWKGTWLGKMPSHEEHAPAKDVHLALEHPKVAAQHLAEVEEAVKVVRQSAVTHVPFAQILVD
jgi:hypothetical protein